MYRSQCPIHKGTLTDLVWSSMNNILMFIILKTEYFQFCFVYKSSLRIPVVGQDIGIIRIWTLKNDNIFRITYQIKVSRVPLWIRQYHLCYEGHLKLRLSPFKISLIFIWVGFEKWFIKNVTFNNVQVYKSRDKM